MNKVNKKIIFIRSDDTHYYVGIIFLITKIVGGDNAYLVMFED